MSREITILTPTYNRGATLQRLYDSLVNQTYQNFVWLVMDDGSTDDTREIIERFKQEDKLEIDYHWHENVKKSITTVRGIHKVKTPFVYFVDSDDELPKDSLQILYNAMLPIKDDDKFSAVIGRLQNQHGEVKGTPFPSDPFDSTWFHLVNRDNVKGPHEGILKTEAIKKVMPDMEQYVGKGYIYDVWNFYQDAAYITRYINDVVYIYHIDETDAHSLTNTKYSKKNAYGLSETHRHYLNAYSHKYSNKYPLPILKQLFKYLYFGMNSVEFSIKGLIKNLPSTKLKMIAIIMLPMLVLHKIFNPLN